MRVLLILMVALAGCSSLEPVELTGDTFVVRTVSCGFVPAGTICSQDLLRPDGTLIGFNHGETTDGAGRITFEGTPNVSAAAMRQAMQDMGTFQDDLDYHLKDAYQGTLSDAQFRTVLARAENFQKTAAHHNKEPNLADGSTTHLTVVTLHWEHSSSAYIGRGDASWEGLDDAMRTVIDTTRAAS